MGVLERAQAALSRPTRITALAGTSLWAATVVGCRGPDGDTMPGFPPSDYHTGGLAAATEPVIGTNYTHHSFDGCSWDDRGILDTYQRPGVADEVHEQLRQIRLSGVASLRLIIWHMRDVPRQSWGVVPSRGGRLPQPFRDNLVSFLTEVRRFGFRRLTISFSPEWSNDPREDVWSPDRFQENWEFIQDVRSLARRHGPGEIRFDLLNEGAPSDHAPAATRARVMVYVTRLWRRYANAFGVGDATLSVIAPETPDDEGRRLQNLLVALGEDGAPLPTWFELHVNYHPRGVGWGLNYADSVLDARRLDQPITIGETSYNDAAVADAIRRFMAGSDRPLHEVIQWFKRAGAACEASPPYEADAYLRLDRRAEGVGLDPGPLG